MAKLPVRLKDQQHKLPEEGRIRFGIRDATRKGAPKAIPWFRFTSTDREAIESLAQLYGGRVKDWQNGYKRPAFEVVTEASDIRIVLPPNPLTQWYETWSGGGCTRRCDGETCTIPRGMGGPDTEPVDVPCVCLAENALTCKPKTRLSVVLPDLAPFRGVWRLETGGDHAREELPAMVAAVAEAQGRGMTYGVLSLQPRSEYRWDDKTQKRTLAHYVTPVVGVAASFDALLAGDARAQSLGAGGRLALPPGAMFPIGPDTDADASGYVDDDPRHSGFGDGDRRSEHRWNDTAEPDIEDAEIVEDAMSDLDAPARMRDGEPEEEWVRLVEAGLPVPGDDGSSGPGASGWEDPDERDEAAIVEDEMRSLRSKIAMDLGSDDVRHALARWVSKGRTDSTRELRLEELRRLAKGAREIKAGKVRVELVDGEAKVERVA